MQGRELKIRPVLLLFVSVLTETLFTLVRSHFMSLTFFSAWHNASVF